MNSTYKFIRENMQRLAKNRRTGAGRPHKDPEFAKFNQEAKLYSEAVNLLPPSERKKWRDQVKSGNNELIEIGKWDANQRRISSRKQSTTAWKLPKKLAISNEKSISKKLDRMQAIKKLIKQSHTIGVKPTTRVVKQGLRNEFPHLADIKEDTLRKIIAMTKKPAVL